ncbi:MAG: CoA transferase [Streptosporangiaceae bacterium]
MNEVALATACLPDLAAEQAHLAALLSGLGDAGRAITTAGPAGCAVLEWARSGLAHLTGPAAGPPLAPAAPVLARASIIADAIAGLTAGSASSFGSGVPAELDAAQLLTFRAALHGWRRLGRISPNGSCRILRAADGWLAVNLSRPDDVRSVPAVIGRQADTGVWAELGRFAAGQPAAGIAARAQLVGIPAAVLGAESGPPVRLGRLGQPGQAAPFVLDLSAMWAGPLCACILQQAGWQVLKVEDSGRPDGARSGPKAFYASLHDGIPAVRLDFASASGRAELARLAARAGIVVESSRPRALRRLGVVAEDWLAAAPGRVWVSVTGYGRDDPAQRVAFGDDAAVAGGLVAWAADGTPVFCGDAIADPLTGLLAGLAVLAASAEGGGRLVDVAMAGVCADLARPAGGPEYEHRISQGHSGWLVRHGDCTAAVRSW